MNHEPEAIKIIELSYDPKDVIGIGGFARVYSGLFNSVRPVAIKRLQRNHNKDESTILNGEIENLQKAGDHPNVLKYINHEMDQIFIYIATELCSGTLEDYFSGKYDGPKFTSEKEILLQVTKGLAHLHEKGIVHRDIKPTNILVFVPEANGSDLLMKLADFGISKALNPDKEDYTNTSVTNPKGTKGWMAPELYHQPERFDSKVDIFPLGLIFAYTLSKGNKHPFGDDADLRIARIKQEGSITLAQQDLKEPYSDDNIAFELIKSMLNKKPDDRPAVGKIVDSTFFNALVVVDGQPKWSLLSEGKSVHQRRQTTKEWKDMNELLSDADLGNDEKGAIRKKDLNWICKHVTSDLKLILTLVLAENGADLNARDYRERMTPTLQLCSNYYKDDLPKILELLINKGAKVEAVDPDGRTVLHLVCLRYSHRNLKEIVDLLIKKNVPVGAKDQFGNSALHLLSMNFYEHDNMKDVVELLIKGGVAVEAKNGVGETALQLFASNYEQDNMKDAVYQLIKELESRLLEAFDKKEISDKEFKVGLEKIHENVRNNQYRKQK